MSLVSMWTNYRRAVYYANASANVEMHKALFNIFCREFTFRMEESFNEYLSRVSTGFEPQSMEQFCTCLKWNIVSAFDNSYDAGVYLYDGFQVITTPTEDGRTKVHLHYRRDKSPWALPYLEYEEVFPMLNEQERDEIYAKFYK